MAETLTALTGSVIVGGTHYAEVKAARLRVPDIQGIEEKRSFGDQAYIHRTRPEGVAEGEIDFITQDWGIMLEFGSPTPNDPQGPISPIDYTWENEETGSFFRIRFASAYPTTMPDVTQDRENNLEGTITFQCAKKDVAIFFGSPLS